MDALIEELDPRDIAPVHEVVGHVPGTDDVLLQELGVEPRDQVAQRHDPLVAPGVEVAIRLHPKDIGEGGFEPQEHRGDQVLERAQTHFGLPVLVQDERVHWAIVVAGTPIGVVEHFLRHGVALRVLLVNTPVRDRDENEQRDDQQPRPGSRWGPHLILPLRNACVAITMSIAV